MVDAVTNNRSLVQPLVGGDIGTWGTVLNNALIAPLDTLLGGVYTATVNVADVTLTTTQVQNAILNCTGVLTGNRNLVIPFSPNITTVACGGPFIVVNNCTGNFTLTVKTQAAGSQGVVIPYNEPTTVYSDGINVNYSAQGTPAVVKGTSGNPTSQLAGNAASTTQFGSLAADYVNGALYLCTLSGTAGSAQWANVAGNIGFDTALNLSFTTTVSGNVLTVSALANNTGTTPAAGSPIVIPFRSSTAGSGAPSQVSVTGALSISTIVGASLGAQSGSVPFRFWIVGFNNAGTVSLGLINCLLATSAATGVFQLYPLNEGVVQSSTQMTAGATSAGTFYTPNGVTLVNCPIRVLGYLEYSSGLVTAGTYNIAPTNVQLFGPGIKKPGDPVQMVATSVISSTTISSTVLSPTGVALSITPTSACNTVRLTTNGDIYNPNPSDQNYQLKFARGTTLIGMAMAGTITKSQYQSVTLIRNDVPYTTAVVPYTVYINITAGSIAYPEGLGTGGAMFEAQEIMA